jgi:hypothetical protein
LDQRQQTLWATAEAEVIGRCGCLLLASVTGMTRQTILKRKCQFELTGMAQTGSLVPLRRSAGAGRRATEVNDPEIEPALEQMPSEEVAGDPMGLRRWVCGSSETSASASESKGIKLALTQWRGCCAKWDTRCKLPRRSRWGAQHPDRDEQFKYIAALKARFLDEKLPVISIDTKRKTSSETTGGREKVGAGSPWRWTRISQVMRNV